LSADHAQRNLHGRHHAARHRNHRLHRPGRVSRPDIPRDQLGASRKGEREMLDRLALQGNTAVFTAARLAAGTTTTVTITNEVQYKINGKIYKKTAASNIAAPTTDALKATAFSGVKAGYCSVFTYGLNANGDLKCVQGSIEPLDRNYSVMNAPQWGAMP